MQKRSDAFLAIVGAALLALALIFNSFYEEFAKEATLQLFSRLFGDLGGQVLARLTQMAGSFMGAFVVVVFLYKYLKHQLALPLETRHHFKVASTAHCTSKQLIDEKGQQTELYRNTYFLQVTNGLDTGATLKRVQARIFHLGEPVLTEIKGQTTGTTDIRHGEWVFVRLGSIVSKNVCGLYEGTEAVSEDFVKTYSHNTPRGFFSFEVNDFSGKRHYGLSYGFEPKSDWTILIVISADDVLSFQAYFVIDMSNLKNPIRAIQPLRS